MQDDSFLLWCTNTPENEYPDGSITVGGIYKSTGKQFNAEEAVWNMESCCTMDRLQFENNMKSRASRNRVSIEEEEDYLVACGEELWSLWVVANLAYAALKSLTARSSEARMQRQSDARKQELLDIVGAPRLSAEPSSPKPKRECCFPSMQQQPDSTPAGGAALLPVSLTASGSGNLLYTAVVAVLSSLWHRDAITLAAAKLAHSCTASSGRKVCADINTEDAPAAITSSVESVSVKTTSLHCTSFSQFPSFSGGADDSAAASSSDVYRVSNHDAPLPMATGSFSRGLAMQTMSAEATRNIEEEMFVKEQTYNKNVEGETETGTASGLPPASCRGNAAARMLHRSDSLRKSYWTPKGHVDGKDQLESTSTDTLLPPPVALSMSNSTKSAASCPANALPVVVAPVIGAAVNTVARSEKSPRRCVRLIYEGWLLKESKWRKQWRPRYVLLLSVEHGNTHAEEMQRISPFHQENEEKHNLSVHWLEKNSLRTQREQLQEVPRRAQPREQRPVQRRWSPLCRHRQECLHQRQCDTKGTKAPSQSDLEHSWFASHTHVNTSGNAVLSASNIACYCRCCSRCSYGSTTVSRYTDGTSCAQEKSVSDSRNPKLETPRIPDASSVAGPGYVDSTRAASSSSSFAEPEISSVHVPSLKQTSPRRCSNSSSSRNDISNISNTRNSSSDDRSTRNSSSGDSSSSKGTSSSRAFLYDNISCLESSHSSTNSMPHIRYRCSSIHTSTNEQTILLVTYDHNPRFAQKCGNNGHSSSAGNALSPAGGCRCCCLRNSIYENEKNGSLYRPSKDGHINASWSIAVPGPDDETTPVSSDKDFLSPQHSSAATGRYYAERTVQQDLQRFPQEETLHQSQDGLCCCGGYGCSFAASCATSTGDNSTCCGGAPILESFPAVDTANHCCCYSSSNCNTSESEILQLLQGAAAPTEILQLSAETAYLSWMHISLKQLDMRLPTYKTDSSSSGTSCTCCSSSSKGLLCSTVATEASMEKEETTPSNSIACGVPGCHSFPPDASRCINVKSTQRSLASLCSNEEDSCIGTYFYTPTSRTRGSGGSSKNVFSVDEKARNCSLNERNDAVASSVPRGTTPRERRKQISKGHVKWLMMAVRDRRTHRRVRFASSLSVGHVISSPSSSSAPSDPATQCSIFQKCAGTHSCCGDVACGALSPPRSMAAKHETATAFPSCGAAGALQTGVGFVAAAAAATRLKYPAYLQQQHLTSSAVLNRCCGVKQPSCYHRSSSSIFGIGGKYSCSYSVSSLPCSLCCCCCGPKDRITERHSRSHCCCGCGNCTTRDDQRCLCCGYSSASQGGVCYCGGSLSQSHEGELYGNGEEWQRRQERKQRDVEKTNSNIILSAETADEKTCSHETHESNFGAYAAGGQVSSCTKRSLGSSISRCSTATGDCSSYTRSNSSPDHIYSNLCGTADIDSCCVSSNVDCAFGGDRGNNSSSGDKCEGRKAKAERALEKLRSEGNFRVNSTPCNSLNGSYANVMNTFNNRWSGISSCRCSDYGALADGAAEELQRWCAKINEVLPISDRRLCGRSINSNSSTCPGNSRNARCAVCTDVCENLPPTNPLHLFLTRASVAALAAAAAVCASSTLTDTRGSHTHFTAGNAKRDAYIMNDKNAEWCSWNNPISRGGIIETFPQENAKCQCARKLFVGSRRSCNSGRLPCLGQTSDSCCCSCCYQNAAAETPTESRHCSSSNDSEAARSRISSDSDGCESCCRLSTVKQVLLNTSTCCTDRSVRNTLFKYNGEKDEHGSKRSRFGSSWPKWNSLAFPGDRVYWMLLEQRNISPEFRQQNPWMRELVQHEYRQHSSIALLSSSGCIMPRVQSWLQAAAREREHKCCTAQLYRSSLTSVRHRNGCSAYSNRNGSSEYSWLVPLMCRLPSSCWLRSKKEKPRRQPERGCQQLQKDSFAVTHLETQEQEQQGMQLLQPSQSVFSRQLLRYEQDLLRTFRQIGDFP